MKTELLNSIEDIAWLQITHLKQYSFVFGSFLIYGNEDCPDKIELFKRHDPTINSKPFAVFLRDNEGDLYLTPTE